MIFFVLLFYFLLKKIFFKNIFFNKKRKNIPLELFFKNFKKYFNFNTNNLFLNQLKLNKFLISIDLKIKKINDDFFSKKNFFYKFLKNKYTWKIKNIKYKNFFQYRYKSDCNSKVRV